MDATRSPTSQVLAAVGVVTALLLAGCAAPAGSLPAEWQNGAVLLPYTVAADHGGGLSASLYPTAPTDQPARCTVYRNNDTDARDQCMVRARQGGSENRSPWAIDAMWASCPSHTFSGCPAGDRAAPFRPRVVAFDSAGMPIAWWDGRDGPDTTHMTE